MKKILSALLTLVICLGVLAGCNDNSSTPTTDGTATSSASDVTVNVAVMKGPTAIGMVKLMDDCANGNSQNKYNFTVAGTADEITPKLIQGKLDIAAVPANLASVLYNKTKDSSDGIRILAVNALGVLYIVSTSDDIKSVDDLKGKTIYSTGKNTTPEYNLRYVLSQNGIDPDNDVNIEFKSEATEIVAVLKNDPTAIAMLPQPYVTVAQNSIEGLKIVLDMTEEWDKVGNGSKLVTGTIVVREAFLEQHPDIVEKFMTEYAASTAYANENVEAAAQLVEKFDIFKAAIAKVAIPYCNITCLTGDEMKSAVSSYLSVLFEQNPQAIGGALPADEFYYSK